jgi:PAS domain S-box-containing protein
MLSWVMRFSSPHDLMNVNPQQDLVITPTVRCQKLLERIPHLAWLMTDRGRIITVNQHWCEYTGQCDLDAGFWRDRVVVAAGEDAAQATEVVEQYPRSFGDSLQAGDRDRFAIAWEAARRWQTPLEIKLQFKGVAEWEWFKLELEPDGDELGSIWICTAIRLGSEAVIPARQSTQFLEALLDFASDGIVACDAAGRLVLFNRMAQQFHGLPPEPLAPEQWAKYYDLYDGDGLMTLTESEIPLFRALQGEEVVNQEMTIKPAQGEARSLLANATAIYSPTGEKLGAVALMRDVSAYKQAMSQIQQSDRKFRAMFDGAFEFIGLLEPDGTIVDLNRIALDFAGLKAEDAIGRPFKNAPCWSYSPAVQEHLQESIARAAQGDFIRYEVELLGAEDRLISIDFSLTPIRNEHGEVTLIVPEGRDISQIKHAQTERLNAELYNERLSTAIQLAKAGAWHWDLRHQQVHWTPEFETLFDYEPGSTQQVYSEWLERIHPEDRAQAESKLHETIDQELAEYRNEYRIVCRDGQIRWIDAIGELRHDEQGNLEWLSGLVYDITDRKQVEIALQASEELFRHTFEYTSVGFCHVALDGTWLRVNQKLCEIVGYSQAELLATTFQAITEPADLAADLALVTKLVNGEITEYSLEKRYIHKQGHHVWVTLTVSLMRENALDGQMGAPQHFLAAIQDISERKHLELLSHIQTADLQRLNSSLILAQHQLKERNQELDAFVYMVSHDLKAPLRSISNLSEWIEEDLRDRFEEDECQQFEVLRQRVRRMDALIDGLLHYSRVGSQKLESETVDVNQLVAEMIDSIAPPAGFRIEILSPLPTLDTKRILLAQIFANLLTNAIKHHDQPDGLIEIGVKDLGDRYQFSIADDGPGIPLAADRHRIFEMFQTLKPSTSTENTGIGLALVKKIIEGEGGRIWLDIDRSQGACFYFTWSK